MKTLPHLHPSATVAGVFSGLIFSSGRCVTFNAVMALTKRFSFVSGIACYSLPIDMATTKSKAGRKTDRDEERRVSTQPFVRTLRRMADALEAGKTAMIQIRGERIRIPREAFLSIEHEREGGAEELELQLKWKADK